MSSWPRPFVLLFALLALLATVAAVDAQAVLAKPALTAAQQQAAEQKKRDAAAQAEQEKQKLAAAMDGMAERWRTRAKANGWTVYPPVAIAAPAGAAPAPSPSSTSQASPAAGQGALPPQGPIRSEKFGTAPASEDIKNPARKGK